MERATRLTFVCRGATASGRVAGFSSHEPIAPGEADRARLAARAFGHVDAVVCAPEPGARETALAFSPSPRSCGELRDVDFGRWLGMSLADVAGAEPEGLAAWLEDPSAAPHGGESIAAAAGRIGAWMDGQVAAGGHLLAVTHATIVRLAVLNVLGAPLSSLRRVDVGFLSAARFSSNGSRWVLRPGG